MWGGARDQLIRMRATRARHDAYLHSRLAREQSVGDAWAVTAATEPNPACNRGGNMRAQMFDQCVENTRAGSADKVHVSPPEHPPPSEPEERANSDRTGDRGLRPKPRPAIRRSRTREGAAVSRDDAKVGRVTCNITPGCLGLRLWRGRRPVGRLLGVPAAGSNPRVRLCGVACLTCS